jgi:hypothetical protein
VNATRGQRCNNQVDRGPSVWYQFRGTGIRLTIDVCDFSREFTSAFHLYRGSCDTLTCIVPRTALAATCADNPAAATVSFRSAFQEQYYVEVSSFNFMPDFDQAFSGITGFVEVRTDA